MTGNPGHIRQESQVNTPAQNLFTIISCADSLGTNLNFRGPVKRLKFKV